jgi:nitrite reductase/ring-hydroxylating ferredoxin subunit
MTWLDRERGQGRSREREHVAAAAAGDIASSASSAATGTPLIAADEVPPGTVVEVVAGDRTLALANVEGELILVDGTCPHAGGPLGDGHLEGCTLTCPWHGWSYDLRTGKSLVSGDIALERFPVEVVDGMVFLSQ